jgi:hypothetical protein
MAKLYQLKEIIDYETRNPNIKPVISQRRNVTEAMASEFSSARRFLDELTLWKTALQIGMSPPAHSNQK